MPRNKIDETDLDLRSTDYLCDQCGQGIPLTTTEKRKSRNDPNWGLCIDCTRGEVRQISYKHPVLGLIFCYPHKGDVDELWRPLDEEGNLFRPGERICGHKDCVNLNHVIGLARHKRYQEKLQEAGAN